MEEILTMSVVEMAGRIRKGELSPVKVLEAHIQRIEEINPRINAVVVPRFEEARKEAKEAEDRLARSREELPPLFGVPCTMKDCFSMKGLPWAAGVWARRNLVADSDATVVERLKAAGAIIMGKTNVPEAAMWLETYNHVYGRTRNPYDPGRGAGGSSGGEGAIIAAAGSPFGIGSDIGGSIRYPSAFNGVAGHKPTGRLVPATGHWPPAPGLVAPYCCYGPIARRVSDLAYILPIISGPDGRDEIVEKRDVRPLDSVDPKNLRVFYYDSNGQSRPSADVRSAVNKAAEALAGQNIPVEYWRPEGVEKGMQIWQGGLSQNPVPFIQNLYLEGEKPVSLGRELLKFMFRRSKITFPALGVSLIEGPGKLMKARNRSFIELAADLRDRIEQRLGENGVIICPVFTSPAPRQTWEAWMNFIRLGVGYSGIFNIMELPSTIIPIFHRQDGLPVSVQVVSARFNDHLTMATAKILEEIFGGWKPKQRVKGV
jgi:fatty acid amide hydrolase 2